MPAQQLIALDWGTTSLRAYFLDGDGRILDRRSSRDGIMRVEDGQFGTVLEATVGPWHATAPDCPMIACGMIGSAQGWVDAGYLPCPASADDIARDLAPVTESPLLIVPGLLKKEPADVMRGEETQIFGALSDAKSGEGLYLLPGTHTKWVDVAGYRVTGFSTYMTGEMFDTLRSHSILGRLATDPAGGTDGNRAFEAAVHEVMDRGRAAPLLFGTRAKALLGEIDASVTLDYLSGLLIAEEILCATSDVPPETPINLIGGAALCGLYAQTLEIFGFRASTLTNDVTAAGLYRIARLAGLVT